MSEKFEEIVLKKLDELFNELKDTREEVSQHGQEIRELRQEVTTLGKEVTTLGKDVIDLRQRFTVFDFEINKKIDTLFDSDTVNKEDIVSLNVKNYNHDTRISNLENKDLSFAKV